MRGVCQYAVFFTVEVRLDEVVSDRQRDAGRGEGGQHLVVVNPEV